jgi:hypothetical protein
MRILPVAILAALLLAAPARAAILGPPRTVLQAESFLLASRVSQGGNAYCVGRRWDPAKDRPHKFRTFACVLTDYVKGTSTAYYLATRPNGEWAVRIAR